MKRVHAAALATATMLGAASRPADAFVRYQTMGDNKPFFWAQATVPITAYPLGFTQPSMTTPAVQGAIEAAAAAWSAAQNGCTYLNLEPSFSTDTPPPPADDGRSTILFHSVVWCQVDANGDCPDGAEYDPSALAITTDTARTATGQIIDADVEVNLVDYQWADVVANPDLSGDMDLQNALTHEMGHLIGLDHTCWEAFTSTTGVRPVDNTGQPVPDCATASPAVQATTMFPSATPGDTQKRTLAPDDQNGLCTIYPVDDPPGGCSCAVGGGSPLGALAAPVLALLGWVARRRRTPRAHLG